MPSFLKKIIGHFKDPSGEELFILPELVKKDLLWNLKGTDEKIVLSLKTHRAIHKAPSTRDSNTYYNAYAIITTKRLIIAKDSSKFNTFREIQLSSIGNFIFQDENKKPNIKIESNLSNFTLTFPPGSINEAEIFYNTFRRVHNDRLESTALCSKCGQQIAVDSVYCSHCGEKLDI